jgi:hypothetical protein
MTPHWGRSLAIVAAVVFFVSLIFPVAAGLSHDTASFPKLWGRMDLSLAFVLAVLAMVTLGPAQDKVIKQAENMSYRAYRILIHGIFAMLVVFFVFGSRIVWSNCKALPSRNNSTAHAWGAKWDRSGV